MISLAGKPVFSIAQRGNFILSLIIVPARSGGSIIAMSGPGTVEQGKSGRSER